MFGVRPNSTLSCNLYQERLFGHGLAFFSKGFDINVVDGVDQLFFIVLEFFQNWSQEKTIGGKGMAAAVQTRFDTVFRNPDSFFSQKTSLNQSRAVIAYFQDDFFL